MSATSDPVRRLAMVGCLFALSVPAPNALARPAGSGAWWPARSAVGLPALLDTEPETASSETAIDVTFGFVSRWDGRSELLGGVVLALPMDRGLAAPVRSAASRAAGQSAQATGPAGPGATGADTADEPCDEPEAGPPPTAAPAPQSDTWLPPPLASGDLRAAVAAAQRSTRLDERFDELDDLTTRARWSAVMPELRLRATRQVDESESLAPTQYDENRVTARGGTSLWLEARGSWRLDRAVFADEEIRVASLRQRLDVERERVRAEVVTMLFDWQRAVLMLTRNATDPGPCWESWLRVEQLGVELDLVTGGWFAEWSKRNARRRPAIRCGLPSRDAEAGDGAALEDGAQVPLSDR